MSAHIINLETRFFGMTRKDLRKLTFQLAEKDELKHRFNKEKGIAGRRWPQGFLQRNPRMAVGTPENTFLGKYCGILCKANQSNQ
jgi:hypothetical protein